MIYPPPLSLSLPPHPSPFAPFFCWKAGSGSGSARGTDRCVLQEHRPPPRGIRVASTKHRLAQELIRPEVNGVDGRTKSSIRGSNCGTGEGLPVTQLR